MEYHANNVNTPVPSIPLGTKHPLPAVVIGLITQPYGSFPSPPSFLLPPPDSWAHLPDILLILCFMVCFLENPN